MSSLLEESRSLPSTRDVSVVAAAPRAAGRDARIEPKALETEQSRYRTWALRWVIVATVVRFLCVARIPLGNGEAYYFTWSRFLSLSYNDHPPLVAWMVRLTTAFGISPASVRLGPVLAAGLFGYLLYRLGERLATPRAALYALVLVTGLPVFLISSLVLNPEAALAPLWVGFLLAVEAMRERDEPWRPLVAGALLGAAFLAKYTAILLVPAVLLYAVASKPMRRWFARPSFYLGALLALLVTLPVIVWNHQRGWPSLHLHLVERAAATAVPVAGENKINHLVEISSSSGIGALESVLRLVVGQVMSYSPLLAPLLVVGIGWAIARAKKDDRALFLASFCVPVLLFLLVTMARVKDSEQHWTMMAFVPAVLAAGIVLDGASLGSKALRWLGAGGVALSGAFFVLANVHVHSTALLRLLPADKYDPKADLVNELVGWDRVKASVAQAVNAAPGEVVLASTHYSMCGRLAFETGDQPPVFCLTARRTAYDFFGRRNPPADASIVLVTTDVYTALPSELATRACSLTQTVDVQRAGRNVARYLVHTCRPATAAEPPHPASLSSGPSELGKSSGPAT
jgi:hypothetical protein